MLVQGDFGLSTVRQDVAKAMKAGSALVQLQASLEHLETAEPSWDKCVVEHGIVKKLSDRSAEGIAGYLYLG